MRRRVASGLVALAALLLASSANASEVLLDQIDPFSPESHPSQDFEPAFDEFDSTIADDFTVPTGETWAIELVQTGGKSRGPAIGNQARVAIYSDGGTQPGDVISTVDVPAGGYPRMVMNIPSPPTLAPGTYWISVEALLAAGSNENPNQWFWAINDEGPFGAPAVFKNPGDGFATGCTSYAPRNQCNFPDTPTHPGADMSFLLRGTRTVDTGAACTAAKAERRKAKSKLKKAKQALEDAKGKAAKADAKAKVKKAKKRVVKAEAAVTEACG
jgi:hypothetical protein